MARDAQRRPRAIRTTALITASMLAAMFGTACGGSSTAEETTTTLAQEVATTEATVATTTTEAIETTTTAAVIELTLDGAKVVVANASSVNGSAGRMTELLAAEGFTMGTPTNSTEGNLGASKIYYGDADGALAVAESLVRVFGGVIQLLEMPTVPPVASSDLGDATVLVALGDDFADQALPGATTASP